MDPKLILTFDLNLTLNKKIKVITLRPYPRSVQFQGFTGIWLQVITGVGGGGLEVIVKVKVRVKVKDRVKVKVRIKVTSMPLFYHVQHVCQVWSS